MLTSYSEASNLGLEGSEGAELAKKRAVWLLRCLTDGLKSEKKFMPLLPHFQRSNGIFNDVERSIAS